MSKNTQKTIGGGFDLENVHSHNLKFFYTNAESLSNKWNEFKSRISYEKPDVISIVETWFKNNTEIDLFKLGGYKVIHHHTDQVRGGVVIYIKENLYMEPCNELNAMPFTESLWCWIEEPKTSKRLLFGTIYRKSSLGNINNDSLLNLINSAARLGEAKLVIFGDFNLPEINWDVLESPGLDGNFNNRFLDTLNDNYLVQHITENTHSLLDLIISMDDSNIVDINHLAPLGKSDHAVVTFVYTPIFVEQSKDNDLRSNFFKSDYSKIKQELNLNWHELLDNMTVSDGWNVFKEKCLRTINDHTPRYRVSLNGKTKPMWLNNRCIRASRRENLAWKRFI